MIKLEDLKKYSNSKETSPHDGADAFYCGTKQIHNFSQNVIISVLKGQLNLNEREKAIVDTYYRAHLCLSSMVKLNELQYFQQVVSSARTIFELLVDLKILHSDKSDRTTKIFHAFPQIAKYKSAEQMVQFSLNNPGNMPREFTQRKKYLDDPANSKKKIGGIITKHWGLSNRGNQKRPQDIRHWTGLDFRKRVSDLGVEYEQLYLEIYDWQSWYIHSGSTGYVGFDKETFEAVFGYSHAIVQRLFLEAILICGEELHLDKIDNLKASLGHIIEKLRLHPGVVLLQKDIEELKKLEPKNIDK